MRADRAARNEARPVTLVGAGPGDPATVTVKTHKAIEVAAVLMGDDLLNEAIVAYASPDARNGCVLRGMRRPRWLR